MIVVQAQDVAADSIATAVDKARLVYDNWTTARFSYGIGRKARLWHHLTASAPLRPVIFITAQNQDSLRERASRIPNSAYLRKPFPGAALLEAVRSLLERGGFGAGSPGT